MIDHSGVAYRLLTDQLGSVRLVVRVSDGNVEQHVDYDPWGVPTVVTGGWGIQSFGFAGGVYDSDTGLVRFGARDYDARVGRWTAKDPVRFEGDGPNLYPYTSSDPANRIDPTGLWGFYWGAGANALLWGPGGGASSGYFFDYDFSTGDLSIGLYSNVNAQGGFGAFLGGGPEAGIIWSLPNWRGASLGAVAQCPIGGVNVGPGGLGVSAGPGAIGSVSVSAGTTTLLGHRVNVRTRRSFWGIL